MNLDVMDDEEFLDEQYPAAHLIGSYLSYYDREGAENDP